jgi:transcriptional regulator with PAS, ATPase and Fis domain
MHSAEQADEKPANKRRRKQNDEIGELGELLPFQGVGGKSLDKLSILRLSTSYIRFQNFMTVAYGENGAHKENVLTNLIDQAMDGFLMVIASDGVILYASDNMESFVALGPRDVIGHSLHDLVQSEQDSNTITKNLEPKGNQLNQHRMFYIRLRNAVTPGRVKVSRYNTNLSLQLNGHLKVVRDHSLNITFSKLSPELADDLDLHDKMVPQRPHVLGLVVECRPIEAVPSILELEVPQVSFTSTVGMDMKIQSVDTQ